MNDNDLIAQLLTRVEELEQKNAANADHARLANANHDAIAKSLKAAETREQVLQQRVEELTDEVARLRPIAKAAVEMRLDAGRERAATEAAEQRVEEREAELGTLRATLKITDW